VHGTVYLGIDTARAVSQYMVILSYKEIRTAL